MMMICFVSKFDDLVDDKVVENCIKRQKHRKGILKDLLNAGMGQILSVSHWMQV